MKLISRNNGRLASLALVAIMASITLSACGESTSEPKKTIEKISSKTAEKTAPIDNNLKSPEKATATTVLKTKPSTVKVNQTAHFDENSQVLSIIDGKERTFFSITPVKTDGKLVLLLASALIESNKPAAKDSLVFSVDGATKSFSPLKGSVSSFAVDQHYLESLLKIKGDVLIRLTVGDGIYYEGNLNVGKTNSFKGSLERLLNK